MVSDEVRIGLTIVLVASFGIGIGGLVIGRIDVAAVGFVVLLLSAWIQGYLGGDYGVSDEKGEGDEEA